MAFNTLTGLSINKAYQELVDQGLFDPDDTLPVGDSLYAYMSGLLAAVDIEEIPLDAPEYAVSHQKEDEG